MSEVGTRIAAASYAAGVTLQTRRHSPATYRSTDHASRVPSLRVVA